MIDIKKITINSIIRNSRKLARIFYNHQRLLFFKLLFLLRSKDKINRDYNLIFLTQYYSANNINRQSEIDYCIEKNLLNTFIDKIILFCEGNFSNTIKESNKINLIDLNGRLTFNKVLQYISEQPRNNKNIYVISNSDIILTKDILNLINYIDENELIALTRWEFENKKLSYKFLPEITQDTWILKDKDFNNIVKNMDIIPLGMPRCDNRFARVMYDAGFTIWNPCLNTKTYHVHSSNVRSYNKSELINGDLFFPLECSKEQYYLKIERRAIKS